MNVTPMCEALRAGPWKDNRAKMHPCDLRAEWNLFNKTSGRRDLLCDEHLRHSLYISPGMTFVVSPARSLAKRDGKGFTVGEAKKMRVCRICGESSDVKKGDVGFILGFGYEHAHASCMDDEAHNHLDRVLSKRGPFRGD